MHYKTDFLYNQYVSINKNYFLKLPKLNALLVGNLDAAMAVFQHIYTWKKVREHLHCYEGKLWTIIFPYNLNMY